MDVTVCVSYASVCVRQLFVYLIVCLSCCPFTLRIEANIGRWFSIFSLHGLFLSLCHVASNQTRDIISIRSHSLRAHVSQWNDKYLSPLSRSSLAAHFSISEELIVKNIVCETLENKNKFHSTFDRRLDGLPNHFWLGQNQDFGQWPCEILEIVVRKIRISFFFASLRFDNFVALIFLFIFCAVTYSFAYRSSHPISHFISIFLTASFLFERLHAECCENCYFCPRLFLVSHRALCTHTMP